MDTLQQVRQVRRKSQPPARCKGGAAQPFKKCAARTRGDGFLNHSFPPFYLYQGNRGKVADEFLASLAHICKHFDLKLPETAGLSFPQDIYKAWEEVAERIHAIDKHLDCIIFKDNNHEATLATVRRYDTGMTLYYIPVRPYWNWSAQAKHQDIAEVLTCIFAYLYQVVRIPFYAETHSYLSQQYDYVDEMVRQEMDEFADREEDGDEDKQFRQEQLDELYTLSNAGLHILRLISDKQWLNVFEDKVLAFSKSAAADKDWAILAIEFVQLYRAYPERSVFEHIRPDLYHPEVEDRIHAEQYLSFYWSGNDNLNETVFDMVDCHLQEMAVTDEPIAVELFDTPDNKTNENFGFETRLFPLISRLCKLLEPYDHAECK